MRSAWQHRLVRALMLLMLVAVCGMAVGLVFAYPVSRIKLSEAAAIKLDQGALAGKADAEQALVTVEDLGDGWAKGDDRLRTFGIIEGQFCGDRVPLPVALSPVRTTVLRDTDAKATLISQAVRVDRWQNAREFVSSVDRAASGCDRFYLTGPKGRSLQRVLESTSAKPIDDYTSRVYLSEDGTGAVAWSLFAVGDVVVALEYIGPSRPPEGFLGELESALLLRLAPEAFAPGGVVPDGSSTTTTTAPAAGGPATSVVEGGSADESGGGG